MRLKTRWMKRKEFNALAKVVDYLDDDRKEYQALKECGELPRRYIGQSLEILTAYIEEVEEAMQVLDSSIEGQQKRERSEGRPFEMPKEMTTYTGSSDPKQARPVLRAHFDDQDASEEPQTAECPQCKRDDYLRQCDICEGEFCDRCLWFFQLTDDTQPLLCRECRTRPIY